MSSRFGAKLRMYEHVYGEQEGSLTVVKVADGGAVLATGRIVDLPCVSPRLRRNQFFCTGRRANHLARRALGPTKHRGRINCNPTGQQQQQQQQVGADLRKRLRLLDWLPGQRDCALERWRVVEQILLSDQRNRNRVHGSPSCLLDATKQRFAFLCGVTLMRTLMLFVILSATTLILFWSHKKVCL